MKLNFISSLGWGHFSASSPKPTSRDSANARRRFAAATPSMEAGHGIRHFFRLHARSAAYAAFVGMVLACLLAAITVASNDMPLVQGGL